MNVLKENVNAIIMCLFEILVGVLLLINPIEFTSVIIITFGAVLVLAGVIFIVDYFRTEALEAAIGQTLAKGLILLLAGLFCILKSYWFVAIFPLLTIVYGIALLLAGLVKVQWTADMIRLKKRKWFLPMIGVVVSILCATIILLNPFSTTAVLWVFTGVSLIVGAILDIVTLFISNNKVSMI